MAEFRELQQQVSAITWVPQTLQDTPGRVVVWAASIESKKGKGTTDRRLSFKDEKKRWVFVVVTESSGKELTTINSATGM